MHTSSAEVVQALTVIALPQVMWLLYPVSTWTGPPHGLWHHDNFIPSTTSCRLANNTLEGLSMTCNKSKEQPNFVKHVTICGYTLKEQPRRLKH
jgi:hypothetical protein